MTEYPDWKYLPAEPDSVAKPIIIIAYLVYLNILIPRKCRIIYRSEDLEATVSKMATAESAQGF